MASSTRKKTTSKSGAGRGKKTSQPAKRPIRREVTGAVLLVLTLCVAVGYCGVHAIFIDWLAVLLKGLFGYGYWLAAPALLLAGLILLLHRGRPVVLRTVCALVLPLLFGALWHTLFCRTVFESSLGILPRLWSTGGDLASGGVLSGALAIGFVAVLSQVVSAVFFVLLLGAALGTALWPALRNLADRRRNLAPYEEAPERERPAHAASREPQEPVRRTESPRQRIDFPLDEEKPGAEEPPREESRFTGFFRHKSERQRTPDQVLRAEEAPERGEAPAEAMEPPA